ncbi:oligopeptidase A [Methylomarinovum tepidoasis]|uniref:oligopeptidase A n=1 Tax=Methylomarinovum tepidoasis TaxID=2840183 RepID=A0AAU9CE88_9GAMM|nr:oligopeptidase A [Methylomarinovum sp. IN45]BCX88523.1 oligopeptidase A [Methylomarinovum sp. IN45]
MTNPLLETYEFPPFSRIRPEHVEPAITRILHDNRQQVARLLQHGGPYTWDNLIRPLEDLDDRLDKAWSPVRHLNAVVNSEALRQAYNACLPKLSDYATDLGQNEALYQAHQAIADSEEFQRLDPAQRKIVQDALRDFRLAGVALSSERKARFKAIEQRLSKLASHFEENVLDATNAWTKHITDEARLQGLPETARTVARQAAAARGLDGWLLTLEFPCYAAVMTFADDRNLRRELYEAYVTRASDQGPHAGRWDNTEVMEEILRLRHEKARLLGYANFAELSLATKMAETPQQVLDFLCELAARSRPVAERDLAELRRFARDHHGIDEVQAWDLMYYSEKLRQHKFRLSQEEVKQYFPATRVVPGLFRVVERLYGLDIRALEGIDVWHPDVRCYEIRDARGEVRGRFYLDLYARPKKRGGAWMDECVARRRLQGQVQVPIAFLTCNFTPPAGNDPALLTHDEVLTLFHEFGHGLHHLLTQVDYSGVSGIRGVEWDAVELPSQFMENFCWQRETLDLIAGHYRSGEPLPEALFQKMLAAKNFQAGMMMVRQLEFALFDFRIHMEYDPARGGRIYEILEEVRDQVAVFRPPAFNRFAHSFSHIFGGGYAAGYYSYKWAEVLSADAFSRFEEEGIFDPATGRAFLQHILEVGGSRPALESFKAFRGREPKIDALLRHSGISTEA